jgi:O-antigen/teichoic acid export membrane protein
VQAESKQPVGLGFLRSSIIYALGDLLTKGVRIILIPYYVAVFSKAELGEMAILTAISIAAWTLCTFGLNIAIARQYYDYGEQGPRFISSVWIARLLGGLPFYAMLILLSTWLLVFSNQSIPVWLVIFSLTSGYLRSGATLVEVWLIACEKPVPYRAFTFSQFALNTSLIILFVSGFGWGLPGAIYAELTSWCIWTVATAIWLLRNAAPNWHIVRWRDLVVDCLPAIPHSFFMWGLLGIDRILLARMEVPLDRIGAYDVAYQLGSYLTVVTMALRSVWLPKYFKQVSKSCQQDVAGNLGHSGYGKTASLFVKVILLAALVGFLLAPEGVWLIKLLTSKSDADYVGVFRIVLLGYVAMAVFVATNQPLLSDRRIGTLAIISGIGLAINVIANYGLIPNFGTWGAAYATVLAYSSMSLITFIIVQKSYQIRWEISEPAYLAVAASLIACGAWWLGESPVGWDLPFRIVAIGLYAALFVFSSAQIRQRLLRRNTSVR